MNRRAALTRTAYLMGTALSTPALTGIMQGCQATNDSEWIPRYLSMEQADLVGSIVDRIIPETNTPGAKVAGVVSFIDTMWGEYYLREDQERFIQGLEEINTASQSSFGKNFIACSTHQQDQLLQEAAEAARIHHVNMRSADQPFFSMIRELTLLGYYTSEVGASQELQYDHVPGRFTGCAPLSDVGGKTWAV